MKQPINKSDGQRAVFASRFGAIAAAVGSAVGLGNIWRFPYEAGIHGGGAFMICYIMFLFLIGVPVLISELVMGRASRSNVFGAYRRFAGGGLWHFTGYSGIVASFLILGFYSVVAGWTVEYFVFSLTGQLDFSSTAACHAQFLEMTHGWRPLLWTLIFLMCNFLVLVGGVTKGIERAANILMPLLFLLLVIFCINSLMMPGAAEGLAFLFMPDFSEITPAVLLGAMGQAFFSLSLGLGCMMTYASYFKDSINIGKTAVTIGSCDFIMAVLAGVIIFPAVFSLGMTPSSGPTLVFEALPYVFSQLPGSAVWSTLFFLLLFIASLTSTVSMSEISIPYFTEEKKLSRSKATVVSTMLGGASGLLCALSFGALSDVTICGMTFFNLFDYVSSNILLPLGGMVCSIFVGWRLDRKILRDQMTNNGSVRFALLKILRFMLRVVCPVAIFLIFLNSIGIF